MRGLRLKSFQATMLMGFGAAPREQEVVYQDGDLILKGLSPDEASAVVARLAPEAGSEADKASTPPADEAAKKGKGTKPAAPAPAETKLVPATPPAAPAPPAETGDSNEAWGLGPEIPKEILGAQNLSPILRFLMGQGLKTKDQLAGACRTIRERAGESCAPLHRIDPATLPDRIERFLAATG